MAKVYQLSPRVLAARANGRKGGLARAARLSAEARSSISSLGGTRCSHLYGSNFYSFANKKRKNKKGGRGLKATLSHGQKTQKQKGS